MKMNLFQPMEKKQEVALIGALLFVGLVAARSWVVEPQLTALRAAQRYETAINTCNDRSENINSELRAKRLWLDKLVIKRGLLSNMVFTAGKAEEFLSDLEAFCVEANCSIGSLRYVGESRQEDSAIVTRTTSLAVQGSYNDIIRLVQTLQSRSQKVSIESVEMTTTADPQIVACRLVISIYVNLDKESGGNEEAQLSQ